MGTQLFKYMKSCHLEQFFSTGLIKIGTLYEYRNEEAYGNLHRGKFLIISGTPHTVSSIYEGYGMIKSMDEISRRYARGTLRAFLEGKQNLNWVLGVIRSSAVRGRRLSEIFDGNKGYGNSERYREALSACRDQGWLG